MVSHRIDQVYVPLGHRGTRASKDPDGIGFGASPVNKPRVRSPYAGSLLPTRSNVLPIGGTGTGKTHLAIAIARRLIRDDRRGRYSNVVDL